MAPAPASDLPPADLAGWFLTFDPTIQWTSDANIQTMEAWLAIAEEIAATNAQAAATLQSVTANSPAQESFVPEPGTLGLLGAAMAALWIYPAYVSLRRNDRSRDHRLHPEKQRSRT